MVVNGPHGSHCPRNSLRTLAAGTGAAAGWLLMLSLSQLDD